MDEAAPVLMTAFGLYFLTNSSIPATVKGLT